MSALARLDKIAKLQEVCLEQEQVDIPTIERIIGSMYAREIFIPKGATIVSRVYKRAYVDIMLSGDVTINDTNGSIRLTGANILEGTPGRKRAGHAHEDTRWITVHDMLDIKTNPIEDLSFANIDEHLNYQSKNARESYEGFINSSGLLESDIKRQSISEPYEPVDGGFYLADSPINGTGVFSSRRVLAGEIIGPSLHNGKKTQLGRYVNHSGYPNTTYKGNKLMAVRSIDTGQEITLCYLNSTRCK